MAFPIRFGHTPLGGGDLTDRSLAAIARLQGRGGYASDPDSLRMRELRVWAAGHGIGAQILERLIANVLPQNATELLPEWEDALGIPNNAARSIAERQLRARLFLGAIGKASSERLYEMISRVDPTAVLHRNRRSSVDLDAAAEQSIMHWALALPSTFDDVAIRKGFDWIVRMMPARSIGTWERAGEFSNVVESVGVEWAQPAALGRAALRVATAQQGETGFDAGTYYLTQNVADLQGSTSMTVAAVVQLSAYTGASRYILEHLTSASFLGWALSVSSSGAVALQVGNGVSLSTIASAAVPLSTPVAIVASYDGTNLRLAVQAVLLDSVPTPVACATYAPNTSTMGVGATNGGGSVFEFGSILGFAMSASTAITDTTELRMLATAMLEAGTVVGFEGVEHLYRAPDLATDIIGGVDLVPFDAGAPTTVVDVPTNRTRRRDVARVRDFSSLVRVDAADLMAAQRAIVFRCATGVGTRDAAHRVFAADTAAAGTSTVDSSIDWRGRLVRLWLVSSTTDIRPGQANDDQWSSANAVRAVLWTGTGGASFEAVIDSSLRIRANSSTGALEIVNGNLSTEYVVGLAQATGDPTSSTDADPYTWTDDGAAPSASEWRDIAARGAFEYNRGADADVWTGEGFGGLHRFAHVASLVRPGAGTTYKVLDTSTDWRDRIAAVQWCLRQNDTGSGFSSGFSSGFGAAVNAGLGSAWPGLDGVSYASESPPVPWFTGDGTSGYFLTLTTGVGLAVFDFTGFLYAWVDSTAVDAEASLFVIVDASPQIGESGFTPALLPAIGGADGDVIDPFDLNAAQDRALLAQANNGVQDVDSDAFPFGPVLAGPRPLVPVYDPIPLRTGIEGETDWYKRQNLVGAERVVVEVSVATGASAVVDSGADWRDRFVASMLRQSTTDLRPSGASPGSFNGTAAHGTFYTYGGINVPGAIAYTAHTLRLGIDDLRLYVRDTDGALMVRNDTGATRYIAGLIEATPQLGPRSGEGSE